MQAMNTTCLKPADSTIATITLEQCGNGIVEEGGFGPELSVLVMSSKLTML